MTRTIKYFLFGLTLCFCQFTLLAQKRKVDSLENILKNSKHDTTRLRLYLALGSVCDDKDNLKYTEPALKLADKLLSQTTNETEKENILKQKAIAFDYISNFYGNKSDTAKMLAYRQKQLSIYQEIQDTARIAELILGYSYYYIAIGNLPKAVEYYQKGLSISRKMNYKKGIGLFLQQMGRMCAEQGDVYQALENFQKSLAIRYELNDKIAAANSLMRMGNIYSTLHNITKALECYHKGLLLYEEKNSTENILLAYTWIGNMYRDNNDLTNALLNYQKGLSMAEELKDKFWVRDLLGNIGNIYAQQGDIAKALDYHNKSLKIAEELKDENSIALSYGYLAHTYLKQKNYKKAKDYSDRSLTIWKKRLIVSNICDAEMLSAQIDSANGNSTGAYEHYKQYILLRDKLKSEEVSKAATREKFQSDYDKQKTIDKAEQEKKDALSAEEKQKQRVIIYSVSAGLFLVLLLVLFIFRGYRQKQHSLKIIEEQQSKILASYKNLETLSEIGQKITSTLDLDRVMGLLYENVNNLMDASLFLISTYKEETQTISFKFVVEFGKVVQQHFETTITDSNSFNAWTVRNKKEIIINDMDIEYSTYLSGRPTSSGAINSQSLVMIPLMIQEKVIGLISLQSPKKQAYTKPNVETLRSLASVIAIALNNAESFDKLNSSNKILAQQKLIIEEKNHEITDSINYALRIQQAMLPVKSEIYDSLPKSFVLFKPKDIVSGDFYFFHKNKDHSVFIAAADCTGHGVPGAFMSIIGSEKLEDAVLQNTDTSEILKQLNKGIKTSLRQSNSDESTRDGMDIALCHVDTKNHIVKYAGANRPIWIIRKGQKEVEEIKATKKAIGGLTDDNQHFDSHELKLQRGDTIYISTDGYADQFSGQEGKKLMTKKFKEILLSIQDKTMQEQEKYLADFVEDWKAGTEQVDDILVIGLRL